jgi:hypothetical protein
MSIETIYRPRRVESQADWLDPDGVKLYTISAQDAPVEMTDYLARLPEVKRMGAASWEQTPAFAIFHDGATTQYLVLCWWANDNELFTAVNVRTENGWVDDPKQYSFCVWDLEVMWHERNFFVQHIYCERPSLAGYRAARADRRRA